VFEYVHANVTLVAAPIVTDDGVAVNVAMIGATGAVTVIVSCFVDIPALFMHVSVYVVSAVSVTEVAVPLVIVPTP
jgi:hypothetical protein